MNDIALFISLKQYLFSIVYRITGSYQDSEDIIQESYLRFQKLRLGEISNLKAYLGKMVAHLAYDLLKKAARRKETYIGPYLPEPIPTIQEGGSTDQIDFAFLVILESLNPIERAVYILREAFDFEYEWISEIVGKKPENCRQVLKRAKTTLKDRKSKFTTSETIRSELLDEFIYACYSKDATKLSSLMREEIISYSDGGGKVHAARIPISGLERTVRFLIKTSANRGTADSFYFTQANGKKAVIGYKDNLPTFLQYLQLEEDRISKVYTILNPEKLRAFANIDKLKEAGLLRKLYLSHFLRLYFSDFFSDFWNRKK